MMLLNHSSSLLFCPPMKPCVGKFVPFSINHLKMNYFSSKNDFVSYKRFNFRCQLDMPASSREDVNVGIGILEFFQGKNILVTGATGLYGKVIVEKILRSTPVGKIYLLIKAKDKDAAIGRLETEIIRSELLTSLRDKYGKYYEGFVREKVIPIMGDICEPNLGMDSDSIDTIRKDVHVIIQSAACTSFNERYDLMVDANVIAPQRVVRFAKTCRQLQLLTHVSTAFVNGRREGIILEKALSMGDTGRKEGGVGVDVADEISLLLKSMMLSDYDANKYFRKLGQQRAEEFGWSNTYQLSKSMGEMVVNEIRGDLPLLIIRPAIIESCYRQPPPGWIQGIRMFDPMAISYGKGLLPAYLADPQAPLDIIPADLAANMLIAAIAKHGKGDDDEEVKVYHVASGISNPLTWWDAFQHLYDYFKDAPLLETANIHRIKFFHDFHELSIYTKQHFLPNNHSKPDTKLIRRCNAKVEYAQKLSKTYEFAGFFKARFDTSNTQKLVEEMSKEEQLHFEVDVRNIDWKKYFIESHLPGLKKYVINDVRATSIA